MASELARANHSGDVLVLGTDSRVTLAVARSLGRRKLRVDLGWSLPGCITTRSRYVREVHRIPAYSPQDDAWKEALTALLASRPYDLIIPCNDSTAVPLHHHRADFGQFPNLYLPPKEAFEVAFDKFKTYDLARSLGICVPQGRIVEGVEDGERSLETVPPPVVLKPRATIAPGAAAVSNVVRKAYDVEEFRQAMQLPCFQQGVLVQENFVGRGVGVEVLAYEGDVLTAFQHARIHETMEIGSSYRKSASLRPELLDAARKLMKALRYTGVAMAEFIVNDESGRWVFLEINGRFWGSLPLTVAAGADFPYYLYQMLVEGKREFPQEYRVNVHCRNLLLDYRGRDQWLKRGDGPRWRQLAQNAWEIVRRDHLDSLTIDDVRPGLAETAQLAGTFLRKVRGKVRWF